jgi:hypothetical protein
MIWRVGIILEHKVLMTGGKMPANPDYRDVARPKTLSTICEALGSLLGTRTRRKDALRIFLHQNMVLVQK